MKKMKLCVAALLLGGYSYGQVNLSEYSHDVMNNKLYQETTKQFQAVDYMVQEVIDAIRMDMYYGHLENQRGNFYINIILNIKNENNYIMSNVFNKRSKTLGEMQMMLDKVIMADYSDCENCDEID